MGTNHLEDGYRLWDSYYGNEAPIQEPESPTESSIDQSICSSLVQCLIVSFTATVVCGVSVGLLATFLWWIELNVGAHCFVKWNRIPSSIRRQKLIVDCVEAFIVMFWPLVCITPVISWSTVKELNLPTICTTFGLLDIIDRLLLYAFGRYGSHLESYVGNVLFLIVTLYTSYKVAWKFVRELNVNDTTFFLTIKLGLQFIFGLVLSLLFNYFFLNIYDKASDFYKLLLTCLLIFIFFLPKLLLSYVITNVNANMEEVYSPEDGIMLAVTYLTASTVVARMAQSKIDDINYFIIISVVHGSFNIIDKLTISMREKVFRFVCKRRLTGRRTSYARHFLADHSLLSIITETTSVVFSCSVAHILCYYYDREKGTGHRFNGYSLAKQVVKRITYAVLIELFMNTVALKVQVYLKFPVINTWKFKWKFIFIVHIIQIILIIVYFNEYVNSMLIGKYKRGINNTCVGFFKRI